MQLFEYNEDQLKHNPAINYNRPYRQCSISVMDTIADPNIYFDEKGICNYYYEYLKTADTFVLDSVKNGEKLNELIEQIKSDGKNQKYDCIAGVSGGVDSTYLALQAKKLGLRPLLVHFDNGWNSELAVKNIERLISEIGFDLYTLVVDWEEFKDLQLSYLKASVVDIEAITDHAIIGTIYRLAEKYGVKYILSGNNIVSEHVLPSHWIFNKSDDLNIKDIHSKFGKNPLRTFPFYSFKQRRYLTHVKGVQTIDLLNYMPYNCREVKNVIIEELGWRDYGGKHYESVFTRFYQGYILPAKFHIDKRKTHLSNLIFSGQLTKAEALEELKRPIYDENLLQIDKEFVLKKLELSLESFNQLMEMPRREHKEFKHRKHVFDAHPYLKVLKPVWRFIKERRN